MPVLLGRTREQLRVSVGLNCGAVKLITSAAAGSTTTFLTDGLFTVADDWNGSFLQFTGPTNNDGVTGRVMAESGRIRATQEGGPSVYATRGLRTL